jgi:transposase
VLNGVLWILRTGAPWGDLPDRYPPYQTCHRYFQQWCRDGTLKRLFHALAEDLYERGGIDITEDFIDGTLVEETIDNGFLEHAPDRLIGDRAYDSNALDQRLRAERGIELIAPPLSTRRRKTQDRRPLRRYKRRWKIERLFAWLQNYRRLINRWERHADNFLRFVHLGCICILLRHSRDGFYSGSHSGRHTKASTPPRNPIRERTHFSAQPGPVWRCSNAVRFEGDLSVPPPTVPETPEVYLS